MDYYQDFWGNYVFNDGTPLDTNDLIARGIDVAGAYLSRSPYVSPDDPRFQQRVGVYPQGYPIRTTGGVNVGGSVSPGGLGASVQISPWMLMVGGLVVGAFLFGKRR